MVLIVERRAREVAPDVRRRNCHAPTPLSKPQPVVPLPSPTDLVIAVDGPAASGKGTIARAIAEHFGLPVLDTGVLYRAVGLLVLDREGDPDDPAQALAAVDFSPELLDDQRLRGERAGGAASRVSVHPAVRAALLDRQRAFAAQPGGAVLDGRDIGTVIAPSARAKLFVTAAPDVRARRRWAERAHGDYEAVLADILARDARDAGRATAPLARAPDAVLLDTSDMAIDAAVQRAVSLVEDRLKRGA